MNYELRKCDKHGQTLHAKAEGDGCVAFVCVSCAVEKCLPKPQHIYHDAGIVDDYPDE